MATTVTSDTLHRTAKYFMDSGSVGSHEEAMDTLRGFGLYIQVGRQVATSRDHQIALLTLVNTARRTLLGGVHVIGNLAAPLLVPLADADTLGEAVRLLGGEGVEHRQREWPLALIGDVQEKASIPSWCVTWDHWRGGVIPARDGKRLPERASGGLAPAFAAAVCASEVFTLFAGAHPLVGRRTAGMSLWNPRANWLIDDESEPAIAFLPSRLWVIGLGNLGQAYLWMLTCLPYRQYSDLELILQDYDRIASSNESTSVLTFSPLLGRMKTRAMAEWLDRRGFRTSLEERRFTESTHRDPCEPGVALCGVDNSLARAALEGAGFDLVVETGLGAGTQAFRSVSMHTFPSTLSAAHIWGRGQDTAPSVLGMPAYQALSDSGLDDCGLTQLASRTVGVPFVGLSAAALAIAELLRRLHQGPAFELVSISTAALEDVETLETQSSPYAFGHVPAG